MSASFAGLTIRELEKRYDRPGVLTKPSTLARLREDGRRGALRLCERLEQQREQIFRQRRRLRKLLRLERELWSGGMERIAGVDEAGVGPLAGPVVAAAVIFPPHTRIPHVDDSKSLDPEQRADLAESIRGKALSVAIGEASVEEINELNVYWAALLAMRRAVSNLASSPELLLVDARRIPDLEVPQRSVIHGDATHFSIAAASIIAKTHRDNLMCEMDRRFPKYGFAGHKGYSTSEHQKALRRHGPCPIHRMSYGFVQELTGQYCEAFYELAGILGQCDDAQSLAVFNLRLEGTRHQLSANELRKLSHLFAKKKGRLPREQQLSLLEQ